MSPITPPPSATSVTRRSQRFFNSTSKMRLSTSSVLYCSPSGVSPSRTDTRRTAPVPPRGKAAPRSRLRRSALGGPPRGAAPAQLGPAGRGQCKSDRRARPDRRSEFWSCRCQLECAFDGLQQRPVAVRGGADQQLIDCGVEVDHEPTRAQMGAIVRIQHHTAAGGEHDMLAPGEVVDDYLLALPKAGLTLDVEEQRNVGAGARLDFMIAVDELAAERFRELAPNSGLACAHEADEEEVGGFGHGAYHAIDSLASQCPSPMAAMPTAWGGGATRPRQSEDRRQSVTLYVLLVARPFGEVTVMVSSPLALLLVQVSASS